MRHYQLLCLELKQHNGTSHQTTLVRSRQNGHITKSASRRSKFNRSSSRTHRYSRRKRSRCNPRSVARELSPEQWAATCRTRFDLSERSATAAELRGVTKDVFLELKVRNTTVTTPYAVRRHAALFRFPRRRFRSEFTLVKMEIINEKINN